MSKLIDLTGKKFGKLTVIKRDENSKRPVKWVCKCECGNECITAGDLLKKGRSISCGCIKKQYKDLTLEKFGRLQPIKIHHIKDRKYYWECKCDCGNTKIVSASSLRTGHVKSCGCLSNENRHKKLVDLTGQRFGKLVVIERGKNKIIY